MGKLFLIPTTIASTIDHHVLTTNQIQSIQHIKYFIVETAKIGRQHIKQLKLATPLQELNIQELNKHTLEPAKLIQPLLNNFDMGIISDCGMPAIADPGSQIVKMAHAHNCPVIPLSANNSLLLALMSSGVNGQSFAFIGYLPIDNIEKHKSIKTLEQKILQENQSQIIIETPFRNQQLLEFLINTLQDSITLAIAIELLNPEQLIISKLIKQWKTLSSLPYLHKREVVFVVGI